MSQNNKEICCGYILKRKVELKEIKSFLYELEHKDTGAKHIHIHNDDNENTFAVAFMTVPWDSTGVAHVLEHTVLCGSEKFPVRDPFFSMLKRSLSSFMNALTASDWTMYPFSTQNEKDFYNLMSVYLDAAFYPKLDELSFMQEGCRLEIEKLGKDSDEFNLVYKGIVYNEMKGAMSSPDQVMSHSILNALYPSTTYSFNSGGDPNEIPDLAYEQLKDFHKRHYHPSNSFFYTYGNIPLEKHLDFIYNKVLKNFKRIDPKTKVPSQPRWTEPRTVTYQYPLGKNEAPLKKSQGCVAWLMADIRDTFEVLSLILLEHILLGNSGSPLRKALIDSGLGSALCDGTGYDSGMKDTLFVCGLKDIEKESTPKVEKIIFDVLNDLSEKGIDRELIDSAIHQIEFHRKEVTNYPHPYGIKLILNISESWFHGGDSVKTFQFDSDLKQIHDELARGPFFENQIKKYFLKNTHRILLTLIPDQSMEVRENQKLQAKLDLIKSKLTKPDLERIINQAKYLNDLQESKEDLSTLPTLDIKDIPPTIRIIEETPMNISLPASFYDQPAGGIFYFTLVSGIGEIPVDLIPYVSFFCHSFSKSGTKKRSYEQMARRISAYTGGIGISSHVRNIYDEKGNCLPFVTFSGKCLNRNIGNMFDIMSEFLFEFNFSDADRLRNLLKEYKAHMESGIVRNGHRYATSLASRNLTKSSALSEILHGVHQLQSIKKISSDLSDENLENIADKLASVARILFNRNNYKMSLVGETDSLSQALNYAISIDKKLVDGKVNGFHSPEINVEPYTEREGWSTASAVSFVAKVFRTVRMNHEDAPALSAISKIIKSSYLHLEIREKGGAYGGYASYSSEDGLFSFGSYRDPHIVSTLKIYDEAMTFITNSENYTDEDVKEAILQVCSSIDRPDAPAQESKKAFYRKLVSLSDDTRLKFKQNLLSLTKSKIKSVAEKYFISNNEEQTIAVISSEEKLKKANEKLANNQLKIYEI